MGRVFTPEQVAMGHVPSPEAHLKAAEFFLGEVVDRGLVSNPDFQALGKPVLEGVVVYGSVNYGSQNIRSDFDVFGKYKEGVDSFSTDLTILLREVDSRYHVGQEPNIWPAEVKLNPKETTLDKSILRHLKLLDFDTWGAGINPVNEIPLEDLVPDFEDMYDFLRAKVNSFSKSFHSSEVKTDSLQRAMESPRSLGRKILQVLKYQGLIETQPHESDTKSINSELIKLFKDDEIIVGLIKSILEVDSNYTKILEYTIGHQNGSISEYKKYFDELVNVSTHENGVIHMANKLVLKIAQKAKYFEKQKLSLSDDLMQRLH